MAIEMMEYRPGKWVKVVDGKIVGRATAKEVAAWQASREPGAEVPPAPTTLEVDLDLPASSAAVDPGRSLDVPLRPAFRRRGQSVKRPAPGPARKPEPAPAQGRDDRIDEDMTVEMAVARERAARRRRTPAGAKAEETADRVMVRRRLPTMEPAPAEKPHDQPASEDTPLPKPSQPPAKTAKPPTPRRRRSKLSAAGPEKQAGQVPAAEAPAAEPTPEERQEEMAATRQGPSYWWIYNANRQPVEAFLKEWMPKYEEKFGHPATVVLCHEDDYAEVEATGVEAEISPLLQPGHFYLGHQDGGEPKASRKKKR